MENEIEIQLQNRGENLNIKQSIEPCVIKETTWRSGDSKYSVPDLGFGIRNMMDRNTMDRNVMDRNTMDRNTVDRNITDRNVMDRNVMDRNLMDNQSCTIPPAISLANKLSATSLNNHIPSSIEASFNSDGFSDDNSNSLPSSHSQPTVFQNIKTSTQEELQPHSKSHSNYKTYQVLSSAKFPQHSKHKESLKDLKLDSGPNISQIEGSKLLSLKGLWDKNDPSGSTSYYNKLEEEKIKRQV